jgi:hypothetical protein
MLASANRGAIRISHGLALAPAFMTEATYTAATVSKWDWVGGIKGRWRRD